MKIFLAASLLVAAPFYSVVAQPASPASAVSLIPAPAPESVCQLYPLEDDLGVYFAPPHSISDPLATRTATFNVTYTATDAGEPWPAGAMNAFDYAMSIWATHIDSPITIEVDASWDDLGGCNLMSGVTLGAASPSLGGTVSGTPIPNTVYPIALLNALYNSDLAPGSSDITSLFNRDCDDPGSDLWYFGTDGATPSGKIDFVSVVLHELGHGLGFTGSASYDDGTDTAECNGSAGGGCLNSPPYVYDRFVVDASSEGTSLLDTDTYPNNSAALGTILTGGSLHFDGTAAAFANGSALPPLYSPGSWQPGSSYAHLDESSYNGSPHALMTPALSTQEANHSPGAITCGLFQDMGWPMGPDCTSLLPVELTGFEVLRDENDILLTWQTAGETNNAGFEPEASLNGSAYQTLGFIPGAGTTTDDRHYAYTWQNAAPGFYRFRLKQIDFDGTFAFSPIIDVKVPLIEQYQLSNPYPNPFNPTTQFTLTVSQTQRVTVKVFDTTGREVQTLYEGTPAVLQSQELQFNADHLPSGTYWIRIKGETFSTSKPVMLVK